MLVRKAVVGLAVMSLYACGGGGSSPDGAEADPLQPGGLPSGTTSPPALQAAPGATSSNMSNMMDGSMMGGGTVTGSHIRNPPTDPTTPTPPGASPVTPPTTSPGTSPGASPDTPPGTPSGASPGTPPTTSPGTPPATQPPGTLAALQRLPVLDDADGNPNDGVATYNLIAEDNVAVSVDTPIGPWTTPMMRYNGLQLPPVIKAKRGTTVTVNVQNNLPEDTTVHWHGFKIPGDQDGGPDTPIAPGASTTYRFLINQPGASLWFHPHAEGTTATQVYRGLAGAFVVTDDITDSLEANKQLPAGDYDIPLMIQDRSFGADNGSGVRPLVYGGMMAGMSGMLGDYLLINGAIQPALNVETRQYRFRLYNGSNARVYDFALSNGANFNVIGTDGGLLPAPVVTDHVRLAPGERAEIVVDFRGAGVNDTLALVNRATNNLVAVQFNVTNAVTDDVTLYTSLPANAEVYQRLTANDANNTRDFVMNTVGMMRFAINSKLFDPNRIDEQVTAGTTEIWAISNTTGMAHPFHAHAIQWQILDINGVPASGSDLGWKDTVLVLPGQTVRFIGRFDPVVNTGLYYYHCHILEHEEAGMMGNFQIQ